VLVPNERGLDRALSLSVREIAILAAPPKTFAHRNLNRGIAESIAMFTPVVARARAAGARIRAYVSMCFGDPWEGEMPVTQVVNVGIRLLELGCGQLSLGDAIGVGVPGHVSALLDAFAVAGVKPDRLAVHFHDTYGWALTNTLTALQGGVTVIDASAGGIGGCPYAESATGKPRHRGPGLDAARARR
jgi:hydroxymethylglutaryl-CoA lyase